MGVDTAHAHRVGEFVKRSFEAIESVALPQVNRSTLIEMQVVEMLAGK